MQEHLNGKENVHMDKSEKAILDMLKMAEEESTPIANNEGSANLIFERDKHGNLWSYNKETGEKVGRVDEHGNNNVAKTFSELIE